MVRPILNSPVSTKYITMYQPVQESNPYKTSISFLFGPNETVRKLVSSIVNGPLTPWL